MQGSLVLGRLNKKDACEKATNHMHHEKKYKQKNNYSKKGYIEY